MAFERHGDMRGDCGFVNHLLDDGHTRVLAVSSGNVACVGVAGSIRLNLLPLDDVDEARGASATSGASEAEFFYLGEVQGTHILGRAVAPDVEGLRNLRDIGGELPDPDAEIATAAVALESWLRTYNFCPQCGGELVTVQSGWAKSCPVDGSMHFPRTDPSVIMAVYSPDGRLLLGRNATWEPHHFSLLAGFVEAGEAAEAAVRREVMEEVGVGIGSVRFLGTQPWPFPRSLMEVFEAEALSTDLRLDATEIAQAGWFNREELAQAVARGDIELAPRSAVARTVIERWYGGRLERENLLHLDG